MGHDSGKCFCPRFISNTCPAGVLSAAVSPGGIQSANTRCLANGEAGGLCHHQGLGDGDGDKGQLLSRDWAVTPGHTVTEWLNYGAHTFSHAACKDRQEAVGSEMGAGGNQEHQWDQGPRRTRKWPQSGASHLSGLHIRVFSICIS